LARAKESLENQHLFRYEDPASSVREDLGLVLDGLPLDLPAAYLPSLRAVSPSQAAEAARRHYGPGPGVTVIVGDVDPAAEAWKGGPPLDVAPLP
jgi:predicted Zn-dependent peptidase